jgi:hypothetical protein
MIDWRSAMRDIVSGIEAQVRTDARAVSASGQPEDRIHTLALYGALTLIAAIVLGTLSVHPF